MPPGGGGVEVVLLKINDKPFGILVATGPPSAPALYRNIKLIYSQVVQQPIKCLVATKLFGNPPLGCALALAKGNL